MRRPDWLHRKYPGLPGHPYAVMALTFLGAGSALAALYLTGGNEHAAAKHPGIDPMPSYAVGSAQPGDSEKHIPPHAHVSGQLVCQNLVVINNTDGTKQVIVRPVLDPQKRVPLNLWKLDAGGASFEQQENAVDMKVYNLHGQEDGSGQLTNCSTEQVTTTQVHNASNPNSEPFVLTEPGSPTHEGDTVPITTGQAISAGYVAFTTEVNSGQLEYLLAGLRP